MAVKEPGWILEAPGKRKMEIKGENGDDNLTANAQKHKNYKQKIYFIKTA